MSIIELFLIAIGLAMDAFAVSICKGLVMKKMSYKNALIAGTYFGGFQAVMPLLGFYLGISFSDKIQKYDHWIAFVLLVLIGINMLKEAREENEDMEDSFSFKVMILLAIATSIDALAVGVSFAFLKVNIWIAITIIGLVTFMISFAGIKIGHTFGTKYKARAEFAGGMILILLGLKILLEHLGIF